MASKQLNAFPFPGRSPLGDAFGAICWLLEPQLTPRSYNCIIMEIEKTRKNENVKEYLKYDLEYLTKKLKKHNIPKF